MKVAARRAMDCPVYHLLHDRLHKGQPESDIASYWLKRMEGGANMHRQALIGLMLPEPHALFFESRNSCELAPG